MIMQSEADADRARQLGAPSDRVHVYGNLKYDFDIGDTSVIQVSESSTRIPDLRTSDLARGAESLKHSDDHAATSSRLIVAGSTTPGEEEMLLAALREIRNCNGLEDTRLLVAPRHPERFDEIARLIRQGDFTFSRRSDHRVSSGASATSPSESLRSRPEIAELSAEERSCDVFLLDTIGELASIYRYASVVFVGGSLVPRGGHNLLEPAAYAKAIIVGPYMENFRQIISDFLRERAVVQIKGGGALAEELKRLLSEPEEAKAMGNRARAILVANRGATERTVAMIRELIKDKRKGA
jgi:3-deoxy-D-manno-octulosonic-acid transferase